MSIIKDNKKFKRTKTQTNPTNPEGIKNRENKQFNIDNETIIEKKKK